MKYCKYCFIFLCHNYWESVPEIVPYANCYYLLCMCSSCLLFAIFAVVGYCQLAFDFYTFCCYCMVVSAIWHIMALRDIMARGQLGPNDHGAKRYHYLPYMARATI